MPRGDGTGPAGLGPMTGRAGGYCAGNAVPGFANRGAGFWGGRGRGWRNWFHATGLPGWQRAQTGWLAGGPIPFGPGPTKEQELAALQDRVRSLQDALETINKQIKDVEAESKK